ncbi:MAG: hypothetical protein EU530_00285 [Promethearchaeota archaeon]|nr:MAG: hypothetical protein EU530_00285 [Candidatus Lokiarchaeota archaeon]
MTDYEHQKMNKKMEKRGNFILWVGLFLVVVAIVFLIIGFTSSITYAIIGAFALVIGTTAAIYGLQQKKKGKGTNIGIVTVKCRKCGYLERAGAEFCSKCGEAM